MIANYRSVAGSVIKKIKLPSNIQLENFFKEASRKLTYRSTAALVVGLNVSDALITAYDQTLNPKIHELNPVLARGNDLLFTPESAAIKFAVIGGILAAEYFALKYFSEHSPEAQRPLYKGGVLVTNCGIGAWYGVTLAYNVVTALSAFAL
jgi:hypothetical protein